MLRIGVDYYPEHWDKKLWIEDADLMQKTGVKVVRLAEFSWSKLEPRDRVFDFEWLDEAIHIFQLRDIAVILGTPTNCPPLWLYQKYPEAIQTGRDGKKIATGIRGHRCYTSPVFRTYAARIIEEMTKRYADKNILAWQIDNELDSNFCCCEYCVAEYRKWLRQKYGTLENLNETYGTAVWSGEFSDWDQIHPPMGDYPYAWFNPAYTLDYFRFASESMVDYVKFQTEIIRKNCENAVVTTNTWFCGHLPDFYHTFEALDVVSYDNYPTTRIPENPEEIYSHGFHLDLMRGIKDKNFWIMEELSGTPGCWMPMLPTTKPGMLKGYSMQALAHGVDMLLHFRWRSAAKGAEMYWHGLIDQSNVPGRRFAEFADLCKAVKELPEIEGTVIKNQCAILYDTEQDYALQIQPQTEGFHYYNQMKSFHDAFTSVGVGVDVIQRYADFSKYRILVVPTLYVVDQKLVERIYKFVKNGGVAVITNRSGVKDMYNNCIMQQLPTVFQNLTGVVVSEYDAIGNDTNSVRMQEESYEVTQWCDILEATKANVVATYEGSFYQGKAAVTKNSYGNGTAYYVGTIGRKAFYRKLVTDMLNTAGISYIANLPEGIEITVREKEDLAIRFLFNNTDTVKTVQLDGEEITLTPFEMKTSLFNPSSL